MQIRLCIFFIFSVCGGPPALIWALRFLILYKGRISAFILLLFISDLMQLLLNVYTLIRLYTYYPINFQFWSSLGLCGFLHHQLVALEGILTLKYPLFSAHIFSLPGYIIICLLVIVFFVPSAFTFLFKPYVPIWSFSLGTTLAPLSLLAVSFIITCISPPTPAIRNTHLLFAVAMVTSFMVYLPFIFISFVDFFMDFPMYWYYMSLCLMSLRVISDPLLCGVVCRENLRDVQTPETYTELKMITNVISPQL